MDKKIAGVFEVERTTVYKVTIYQDTTLLKDFNINILPGSSLIDIAQYIGYDADSAFISGVGKVGETFDVEQLYDNVDVVPDVPQRTNP